jgi:hypothetical protein
MFARSILARWSVITQVGLAVMLAVMLAVHGMAEAESLYALERDGADFRIIDRTTGADIATISTSVNGSWRGLAMSPASGVMYATDTEYLNTIDLTTGAATQVGLFGSVVIRDLTCDDRGQLYGVTGGQGSNPDSLHSIDTVNGLATFEVMLGGSGRHGIAYDPQQPGTIYHLGAPIAEGSGSGFFERIDLQDNSVTPIGLSGAPIAGRALGLVYDPIDDVFRFFDTTGSYYTVDRTGLVTAVGTVNPTQYFGLAFDRETTRVVLFRDGFESGSTDAWASVQP